MMMTPAEFKAARDEQATRAPWSDDRIRHELADVITNADVLAVRVSVPASSRERMKAIALAGGWRVIMTMGLAESTMWGLELVTGGPKANIDLGTYRGTLAVAVPTAAEHHARLMGFVPLTHAAVVDLIDDAIADALRDGSIPSFTIRRHSVQLAVDVAAEHGWLTYAMRDGFVVQLPGKLDEFVCLTLHDKHLGWMDQDEWHEHAPLPATVMPLTIAGLTGRQ
jgi:hypothetical protein